MNQDKKENGRGGIVEGIAAGFMFLFQRTVLSGMEAALQGIQWRGHTAPILVEHMGQDHGGTDFATTQRLLDGADFVFGFEHSDGQRWGCRRANRR